MTNVFISYSRRNSEFVRKLNNALRRQGRETWVDWQDIPRGEEWLNEIHRGIENADAFVFVVSRHSLTSEICNDEVSYALEHNKRVMPLILETIEDVVFNEVAGRWITVPWEQQARDNWAAIRHLNWIFFTDEANFDQELSALMDALDTDQEHVQAHTRYLVRALEWDRGGQKPSLLLHGDEIDVAEAWLSASKTNESPPAPNSLHEAYIAESRGEETRRQERAASQERRTRRLRNASIGLAVMVIIALGVTLLAINSAGEAQATSNLARTDVANADDARQQSEAFRGTVEFEATIFAVEQAHAQIMLQRFGIVPTNAPTPLPITKVAIATAWADPTAVSTAINRETGTTMVQVPSGCFLMGSAIDSAAPVHEICFEEPYWIDQVEVSRERYQGCVDAGECEPVEPNEYSDTDGQPVNNVTWTQARKYCAWRGARLPSEAEWEYAARGPASFVYPWGDEFIPDHLVYIGNSGLKSAPVGMTPPESASWVGALDMSGNVWEWVSTAYGTDDFSTLFTYPYDPGDGREDLDHNGVLRVIRGGSFNDDEVNPRSAQRGWLPPDGLSSATLLVGFRCGASQISQAPQG